MQESPELQVKINDASAQLQVIKGNILVANEELEKVLTEKNKIEDILSKIIEDKNKTFEEFLEISKLVSDKEQIYNDLISRFEDDKKNLQAKYDAFKLSVNKEKSNLKIEIDSLSSDKKTKDDELNRIESAILRANIQLSKIIDLIEENENKQRKFGDDTDKARKVAKSEQEKLDKLSSDVAEKQKELEVVSEQIKKEREAIGSPLKSLKDKEERFIKRVRDFMTLITRLQKVWDKQFPGQSVIRMIQAEDLNDELNKN